MIEIGPRLTVILSGSLITALKIIAVVVGYKIVKLGYNLLVKGIKGEFTFSGELHGFTADLRSASPGLLFLLLGCILVISVLSIQYEQRVGKTINLKSPVSSMELPEVENADLSDLLEEENAQ